jgi:hypothetical protein
LRKAKSGNAKSPLHQTYARRPGQSLDEHIGLLRGKQLIWIFIFGVIPGLLVIMWSYYFLNQPLNPKLATILAALFMCFCFWKVYQLNKTIKYYQLGREGEREVAEHLENLIRLTRCYVYHDVVCKSSEGKPFNIDHVLVSVYGIFVLETKARSKPNKGEATIEFDGNNVKLIGHPPTSEPIEQARMNVKWIREEIRKKTGKLFNVTAIVVYPGWFVGKEQIHNSKDTWVTNAKYLEFMFAEMQSTLTPGDIYIVNEVVRPLTQVQRTRA